MIGSLITESGPTIELARGRPLAAEALRRRADWIRLQVIDLIDRAGLGHYSSSFSWADLGTCSARTPG